jgi:hypothetical protein
MDPYVNIEIGRNKPNLGRNGGSSRTDVDENGGTEPYWNYTNPNARVNAGETLFLSIFSKSFHLFLPCSYESVFLTDKDMGGFSKKDRPIGTCTISIRSLEDGQLADNWYPVVPQGEIHLRLQVQNVKITERSDMTDEELAMGYNKVYEKNNAGRLADEIGSCRPGFTPDGIPSQNLAQAGTSLFQQAMDDNAAFTEAKAELRKKSLLQFYQQIGRSVACGIWGMGSAEAKVDSVLDYYNEYELDVALEKTYGLSLTGFMEKNRKTERAKAEKAKAERAKAERAKAERAKSRTQQPQYPTALQMPQQAQYAPQMPNPQYAPQMPQQPQRVPMAGQPQYTAHTAHAAHAAHTAHAAHAAHTAHTHRK